MSNMTDLWLSGVFFQALNILKIRFRLGELTTLPRPLVGWGGGHTLPIPFPLDAFGVSISAHLGAFGASVVSPPTQISGYAYEFNNSCEIELNKKLVQHCSSLIKITDKNSGDDD